MTSPPKQFRRLVAWLAFDAQIELLETWTAVNAILWGLWVANPFADLFATAPGFLTMAEVPEWLWGCTVLSAGALQLLGRLHDRPLWRRIGARTLACCWMFAAGALAWQNWRWLSSVTYPMLAMASLLVSYRAHGYPAPRPVTRSPSPEETHARVRP